MITCRRNPPKCLVLDNRIVSRWPTIRPDDWCAHYNPKPKRDYLDPINEYEAENDD